MAMATECFYEGKTISVREALLIRDKTPVRNRKYLGFGCIECKKPVRPHKEGGYAEAHFEHLSRNPDCRLSDPIR